ncbi:PD-(D/E)XK nuclease superfamily protein [Spirosomataceae bacterium TFI 002]|nr:PD-(D/E)XK nuclease superfamily protein [Spirosomataceae bacterium TFI 002]
MKSFLSEAATTIFSNHKAQSMKDLCIVLPSRRAVGFMKKELANCSAVPFLSPKVFSIDDFVKELSGLKVADSLTLLFELYDVFQKIDENIVFDEFMAWAPTVLSDFDLIDQYLVPNPQQLFAYMTEVEALKRWNLTELSTKTSAKSYFNRFETIGRAYEEFKKQLLSKDMAYRGMAYRSLAEEFSNFLEEGDEFQYYYFVGLNALSKSEQSIISQLVEAKKVTCIWDTDEFFMNSDHQAGNIPRKYRKEGKFGSWNAPQNLLLTEKKTINIYESPYESLQAKIGAQLVHKYKEGRTVFVVPDENQVQGVLFSLEKGFEDYNISMGIGMKQSKIASLVNDLLDLQVNGKLSNDTFSYIQIGKLIKNPLLQSLPEKFFNAFQSFSEFLVSKNILSINQFQIEKNIGKVLSDLFFSNWTNAKEAVVGLDNIFEFLTTEIEATLDLIEKEFFFSFQTVLNKLKTDINQYKDLELSGLKILVQELFKVEKVAFEGDPNSNVQIMSLLETRCLDFDNVVIISFNEGVIPSSNKAASLLPFEVCLEFGIPIYHDQDAIMAYHFYRLLMRAKNVDIIYSVSKNGSLGSKSEPSRIANQLKYDLFAKNELIGWSSHHPSFEAKEKENVISENITITKTPEIIDKIKVELFNEKRGLSPSSITQYLRCSLQFYFSKIQRLQSEQEIEESFGYNVFGNWIHETLEKISKEELGLGLSLNSDDFLKAKKKAKHYLQLVFDEKYKGYEIEKGWNHIFWKMAISLIEQYYDLRSKELAEGEVINIASEQKLTASINSENSIEKIRIKGLIDAIEGANGDINLIDYKTGKVSSGDLSIPKGKTALETFLSAPKDKYRQLLIYLYLFDRNKDKYDGSGRVGARIYSFRDLSTQVELFTPINDVEEIVEEGLNIIAQELINPQIDFIQTEDLTICSNCDFKNICNR